MTPCFVWVDLEMTGLDPERCVIVDFALILTGPDLVPIAELERTVWQPEEHLARMEPFVREMHTRSGLIERIRAAKSSLRDVEKEALSLVSQHCRFGEGILAGNSIYQDRRFLTRHMPLLEGFLHYRQVDVSSLKVLAKSWYGEAAEFRKPNKSHTALDDIRASIAELAHYRAQILR
jgi:oligoribonuclease